MAGHTAVLLWLLGLLCAVPCACNPFVCGRPGGCRTGEEARTLGLQRVAAERAAHPLQGFREAHPAMAQAVAEVCDPASRKRPAEAVPDEWSVCMRRGRFMAEDLIRFHPVKAGGRFSRKDVLRIAPMFYKANKIAPFAMWVRVEKGVLTHFGKVGLGEQNAAITHWAAFYGFAADLGAFAGKTFETMALLGDGCISSPFLQDNFRDPIKDNPFDHLPIISYSKSKECGHHVVVPTTPWLHTFNMPKPVPLWGELNSTAVFRGTLNTEKPLRAALGFISALGLVNGTDFAFSGCSGRCLLLADRFQSNPDTPYFHGMPDSKTMCSNTKGGCSSRYIDQMHYKPLMVTDGIGAVTRFFNYFAAPGIVVALESEFEQFFSRDVVPMVHYIELNRSLASLPGTLSQGLQWLRENDATAEQISRQASLYYKEHLTVRSQVRSLQLFAALMDGMWDDSHSTPVPARVNGTDPSLADDFRIYRKGVAGTGLNCSTARTYIKRVLGRENVPLHMGCHAIGGVLHMSHRHSTAPLLTPLPSPVHRDNTVAPQTPPPVVVAAAGGGGSGSSVPSTPDNPVTHPPAQAQPCRGCSIAVPFWMLLSGILVVAWRRSATRLIAVGVMCGAMVAAVAVAAGAARGEVVLSWPC